MSIPLISIIGKVSSLPILISRATWQVETNSISIYLLHRVGDIITIEGFCSGDVYYYVHIFVVKQIGMNEHI